jgi:hypothetical protein
MQDQLPDVEEGPKRRLVEIKDDRSQQSRSDDYSSDDSN